MTPKPQDYFHYSYGFMNHKQTAIDLLRLTISILNEFEINHFLISGTLLGHIRHNDFIPWDDDIDILVDESILTKMNDIVSKYPKINLFHKQRDDSTKICFSNGNRIIENECVLDWEKVSVREGQNNYCWPFVDMFIYQTKGAHICLKLEDDGKFPYMCYTFLDGRKMAFFHKIWKTDKFFPVKKVDFLGIEVNIPNDSHYFLRNNYGNNYMNQVTSSDRLHKIEATIKGTITIDLDELKINKL
jgi:hypothetical protein